MLTVAQVFVQSLTMLLPILTSGIVLIASMKRKWLEALNRPLDGGTNVFGPNKTIRGLLVHVVVATAVVGLLHLAAPSPWIAPQYASDPLVLGVALSTSYVAGELVNSFIKRRLNIKPGARGGRVQRFFDNVDGALSSGLVLILGYGVPIVLLAAGFALAIVTHLATDAVMMRLRLKNR